MRSKPFNPWKILRESVHVVLADRRWPIKVGIGGLLMLTVLGSIVPQGYIIEHLENSRKGFRTPLPLWRQLGDKAIMGLLALLFDFAYFALPVIAFGMFIFCVVSFVLFGRGAGNPLVLWGALIILGSILLISFGLSLSPLAKVDFSKEGEIEHSLSRRALTRALEPLNRPMYLATRLASLPLYGPAALAALLFGIAIRNPATPLWLIIIAAWLLASSLFWAWIVIGQMYLVVGLIAEDRLIDARLAERRAALQREQQ